MLEQLALNHSTWLKMAYSICHNKDLSNDLVQDMYLKLHEANKDINAGYVYFTIKSIYLNHITRNREDCFSEFNFNYNDEMYDFQKDEEIQSNIDLINEHLNNVSLARKLIVKHSIEDGLRKFARDSQINKSTVQKHRDAFKKEIWQKKSKG
jgi:DNA-directed RNA polymerase specialized sigma24 family protein